MNQMIIPTELSSEHGIGIVFNEVELYIGYSDTGIIEHLEYEDSYTNGLEYPVCSHDSVGFKTIDVPLPTKLLQLSIMYCTDCCHIADISEIK